MQFDQFQAKIAAQRGYTALLEQAAECAALYDKAQLSYPEELGALFGFVQHPASRNGHTKAHGHRDVTEAIQRLDSVPAGIDPSWVSIPVLKASASSLILARLKREGKAIRVRDLFDYVSAIHPDLVQGTINNIGTSLVRAGTIERSDDGWLLLRPDLAGIVIEGRFWAPAGIMAKGELAAHRREVILHVLEHCKSGLQTVQIVERLRAFDWVKAPVNKDLLKGDMTVLEEDRQVKHSGNSKKWVLSGG